MLEQCRELPNIEAVVVEIEGGLGVLLTMEDAERLREFVHSYTACAESNQVELLGHIEKLENRLGVIQGGD